MRRTDVSRSTTSTDGGRRAGRAGLGLALALLVGCATTHEEDPTQKRLEDLDARMGRIDRILENQSLVQLAQRVDGLQGEVRALNGRIEELQNANEGLRKQQRDLYADLDQRLKAAAQPSAAAPESPAPPPVDSAAGTPAAAAAPLPSPAPASGDEQAQYAKAFETLKAGDYAAAVNAFRQLAGIYPNGALADNTQYWLGEAYYVMRDYDHAAACFEKVLSAWPNSRKAPDAMLKLGYTQFEQKRTAAARSTLQQVQTLFPGSDAARLAGERLQKIPADAR
jgi:tol-pal system protein YbgF